jgi:hypothetical protein
LRASWCSELAAPDHRRHGVTYVVVVIGMFFNPTLRGIDLLTRRLRTDRLAGDTQNGKTEFASRRTDIR